MPGGNVLECIIIIISHSIYIYIIMNEFRLHEGICERVPSPMIIYIYAIYVHYIYSSSKIMIMIIIAIYNAMGKSFPICSIDTHFTIIAIPQIITMHVNI